jgi:electron transfer flavoprotein alpha subunit
MAASLYGIAEERKTIWVFLEHWQDALERVSLELLAKGRELADQIGWPLAGLLLGDDVAHLADAAIACGADEIMLAEQPFLESFTVEAYAYVAFQAVLAYKPSIFLIGASPNGRDLAGRLAVRLATGLNADCTGLRLRPDTGVLVSEVSGFGGGVLALIEMQQHRPQMATVRPGVFPPAEPDRQRQGRLVRLQPPDQHVTQAPDRGLIQTRVVERVLGKSVDLTQVPVLVVGGRGMGGDFAMLRQLAELLGGDIGATRPPVDEGHIERERQIGQTGVVCRPKVAIACGISGAFHFIVGIQEAETVIAINSDPEAPIFEHADYCIVGDVRRVLPALIQALQLVEAGSYV